MRNFTSKQDFCSWLNEFESPILIPEWALHQNIVSVDPRGSFVITLPFAANQLAVELEQWIHSQIEQQLVSAFQFEVKVKPSALETTVATPLKGVKNIIAVTSAKGGWVNRRLQ